MVSKKLFSAVLATLVILSIVGSTVAFAQTSDVAIATANATKNATSSATAKPKQTIAQIVANTPNLKTLARLMAKTNLTRDLNLTLSNYTLFAPTDDAFAKVDASTLANLQNNTTALSNVLYYHAIPAKYLKSDFMKKNETSGTLKTLNQLLLPFSVNGTTLKVDNATVAKADINATNGVIHVIDSVIIPPATGTATASATASGGFLGMPGFEALYAVAGLLVVAYLVIRRRN
ncbi:MAG: fasciclin domain-containing protein [Euryarchaeota archaeon]